jgi:uncharacterized protein YndB with AHSA1/START domain
VTQPSRTLSLVVKRVIAASPGRLFEAWMSASQLRSWWGPRGVPCIHAEVDPRVGGRYRIANALPDGRTLWIEGEFLTIERDRKLVYTWRVAEGSIERVTVLFEPRDEGTEVTVVHERVENETTRDEHARGWEGCLDGLERFVGRVSLGG